MIFITSDNKKKKQKPTNNKWYARSLRQNILDIFSSLLAG